MTAGDQYWSGPGQQQFAIIEVPGDPGGWAYPVVERNTNGSPGWRSGSHFYPDTDVLSVQPLRLAATDQPPADLPATLASVDDVRRVCEAAGLATLDEGRAWQTPDVLVVAAHDPLDDLLIAWEVYRAGDDESMVAIQPSAPSSVLWHAIQAARSAS